MKTYVTEKAPYHFIIVTISLMALPALFLGGYALPTVFTDVWGAPYTYDAMLYGMIGGLYAVLAFYFHALIYGFEFMVGVYKGHFASKNSIQYLNKVLKDALIIAGLFIMLAVPLFIVAELDDAPGILALGILLGYASLFVAAISRLLQREITKHLTTH